jgi:hypothetical protein
MTEKYTHLRGVSVALRGIFCRNEGKIIEFIPICALAVTETAKEPAGPFAALAHHK